MSKDREVKGTDDVRLFEATIHYLDGHSATLEAVEGMHTRHIGVWTFYGEGPEVLVPVSQIEMVCMGAS